VQSLAWDDFDRAEEAIAAGAAAAHRALTRIEKLLAQKKDAAQDLKRGSKLKTKVIYGSPRCSDDAHRRLARGSWRTADPLA